MEKKRLVGVAIGVAVLLGTLFSALGVYAKWRAYQARQNAEILLGELRDLRPGKATIADAERLARIQNRFLRKGSPSWNGNVQHFDFWYDNALLFRLHLAPRVVFAVRLDVYHGSLSFTGVNLSSGPYPSPRHYGASLLEFSKKNDLDDRVYSLSQTKGITVRLYPGATLEQRAQAYSFNLKCLDKIGGCHDDKELLPGPWQTAK
ncbi:MAG: hypothetical protein LAO04_22700 [Acidobacteriia bacterium]|nr:hypothetical protein [Terriglobia bacterium]